MSVNEKMTAIADAIRAKTGGTEPLGLDAMAAAIAGLELGGGIGEHKIATGSFTPASDITSRYTIHSGFINNVDAYAGDCFYFAFLDELGGDGSDRDPYEFLYALLLKNVGCQKYDTTATNVTYLMYRPSSYSGTPTTTTSESYLYTSVDAADGGGYEICFTIVSTTSRAIFKAGKKYTWVVMARDIR